MKSNQFEKFKSKKYKSSIYDKPKKIRKPQFESDIDYQKLLEAGYSIDELEQQELDS